MGLPEIADLVLASDTITPSQWRDQHRRVPDPEVLKIMSLMCAVVEEALETLGRARSFWSGGRARAARTAWAWLFSDEHYPFSFVMIAETLEIDVGGFRRALKDWEERIAAGERGLPV